MERLEFILLIFHDNVQKAGRIVANLNQLEKVVLQAMCNQVPSEAMALKLQIRNASVRKRDNTGAGFYTYVDVDESSPLIKSGPISNIFAVIAGLRNPMAFVLYIKEGRIWMLEGAATEDDTSSIDFSTVKFEVN